MVKKLLKHEFTYYFRTLGLFLPIVLVFGVMVRVFRFFDDSKFINQIAIFSSSALLVTACATLLILSTVISIVRFYKNMYSSEGYLTFTLPITNTQHIFVKLLASMVCQAVCLLAVIAAGAIALSGEGLVEFLGYFVVAMTDLFSAFGAANFVGYIIELILLIIISAASGMLLYYACITVGQTAKKNRILMAVGAYFIYYVATQVISTVFTVIITVLGMANVLDGIAEWLLTNFTISIHIYFLISIVISAVMAAAFWLVTQTIMTKKLNLE